jgi:hypothetical protein
MKEKGIEENQISQAVARIQSAVLALVFAAIGGAGVFMMTAWLLIKGGDQIGPHLGLLSQYFIGYSVSWKGSLVGLSTACWSAEPSGGQ